MFWGILMRLFAIPFCIVLTACTTGSEKPVAEEPLGIVLDPVFEKPEGYPYPLGDMSGTIGKTAYVLKSYDYSVGAIDPNVWVQEYDGRINMRATFESATDPEAPGIALWFEATPPSLLAQGMTFPANVKLVQEQDGAASLPILKSFAPATVTITSFTDMGSGEYDRIKATLTGKLCNPGGGGCEPMDLRFDTGVYQNDW